MYKRNRGFSILVWTLQFALLTSTALAPAAISQDVSCRSDDAPPSIEKAKEWLAALNLPCAEKELVSFLALESVTLEQKVDANLLLGTVYYLMLIDDNQRRRERAKEQFVEACRAYCTLKGSLAELTAHLEYNLPELRELLSEVQNEVDCTPPIADTLSTEKKGKSKLKWLLAGAGVLVVGSVALLVSGGGDDSGGTAPATTPEFPNPPK